MKSRDFCYWLQGFAELAVNSPAGLTDSQWAAVKRHLALVFKHEIDPEAGDAAQQDKLNEIHSGGKIPNNAVNSDILYRC